MAETSREIMNDMKSTGKQAVQASKDAYQDVKSNLNSSQINDQLVEGYETLRKRAEAAVSTSEDFVKGHPLATLLGAAAVGFVAGFIARRSRH